MSTLLKWNQYEFVLKPGSDKSVTVVASNLVEAMITYYKIYSDEPFSVHCLGVTYLLDSD